jgi:hypothetical protein
MLRESANNLANCGAIYLGSWWGWQFLASVEASEVRIFSTVSLRCAGHIGGRDGGGEVTVTKRVYTDITTVFSYNTTRDLFGLSFQANLLTLLHVWLLLDGLSCFPRHDENGVASRQGFINDSRVYVSRPM